MVMQVKSEKKIEKQDGLAILKIYVVKYSLHMPQNCVDWFDD